MSAYAVPPWLDAFAVRFCSFMHCWLFGAGVLVAGLGLGLSARLAPSWSSTLLFTIGACVMGASGTAVSGIRSKQPDMVVLALYGLQAILAWVVCVSIVLLILVAQVDSPVAAFVICNWEEQKSTELDIELCSSEELNEAFEAVDCASVDLGVYDQTVCQQKRIDEIHDSLRVANSFAKATFVLLLVGYIVASKVRSHYMEHDERADAFTKLIVVTIFGAAGFLCLLLFIFSVVWWQYTFTAQMLCLAAAIAIPAASVLVFAVVWDRHKLLMSGNVAVLVSLFTVFASAIFGGFFTGDLQTVSNMYHKHYAQIREDFEKVLPDVCLAMNDLECKDKMKLITLDALDSAFFGLIFLAVAMLVVGLLTWRTIVHMNETLEGLHGLSDFNITTLEKVMHLGRKDIIFAADLYWDILHHPHRPLNDILRGQGNSNLEKTLRNNERKRLQGLSYTSMQDSCLANGLDPIGPPSRLRKRLMKKYSADRKRAMIEGKNETDSAIAKAKRDFFTVGEAELRLIPALAWNPFLERIQAVFSESDPPERLHFEEFLNMFSVFSATCPVEDKIRYAWCMFDLQGSGDIRYDEVEAVVMQVLGLSKEDMEHAQRLARGSPSPRSEPEEAVDPSELDLGGRILGGSDQLDEIDELNELDDALNGLDVLGMDVLDGLEDDLAALDAGDAVRDAELTLVPEQSKARVPPPIDVEVGANGGQPAQQNKEDAGVLASLDSALALTRSVSVSLFGGEASQHTLEKDRLRRQKNRDEKLRLKKEQEKEKKRAEYADVQQLLDTVMREVDEDGDEIMNYHEFRKALLGYPGFADNFQLPAPSLTELLAFPQAEEVEDGDDEVYLDAAERKLLLHFSTGHRRRRKSVEDEKKAKQEAAKAMGADPGELEDRKIMNPMNSMGQDDDEEDANQVPDADDGEFILEEAPSGKVAPGTLNKGILDTKLGSVVQGKRSKHAAYEAAMERQRKVMWEHFQNKQDDRQKLLKQMQEAKLGRTVLERPDALKEVRNPQHCISIYTQLIAQRQKEIYDAHREKRKREKKQLEKLEHKREHALKKAGLTPESPDTPDSSKGFSDRIFVDWNTFDVDQMQRSLAIKSFASVRHECTSIFYSFWDAFESIQNQDKIPLFTSSLQRIEGDFGAGIASVFSLKRWLFCINLYMSIVWTCFVILPLLMIDDTGNENADVVNDVAAVAAFTQDIDGSGSLSVDLVSKFTDRSGMWSWMYYSNYKPRLGDYRVDFSYLFTIMALYVLNMSGVLRNIAITSKLKYEMSLYDEERSFVASGMLFGGYDHKAPKSKIVLQNQVSVRNQLRAILMAERAKDVESGIKGRLQRMAGMSASLALAVLMGWLITLTLQNTKSLNEMLPNGTNNIILLIKTLIPYIVPMIVQFEGRADQTKIMQTIIYRVFACQMVSLALMFWELYQLQKSAAANGECFEDVSGDIYMATLQTDFIYTMLEYTYGSIKKQIIYFRLANGGFLGKKEKVPKNIATVLTKERLPEYTSEDAAVEVISMLYRQCVIWVGATTSPAMALYGMVFNLIIFFTSKWALLKLYRPPKDPWAGEEAKALNTRLLFLTLIFASAPLLAWVTRAPACGPHKGVIVLSVYADYMQNDVSPLIQNTIGAATVFIFKPATMAFLLASLSISFYFKTAENETLRTAVNELKSDFKKEHAERVALIIAARDLDGFVLPPTWQERDDLNKPKVQALEGIGYEKNAEGNSEADMLTWAHMSSLLPQLHVMRSRSGTLMQDPLLAAASSGNRVDNPMNGVAAPNAVVAPPTARPTHDGSKKKGKRKGKKDSAPQPTGPPPPTPVRRPDSSGTKAPKQANSDMI